MTIIFSFTIRELNTLQDQNTKLQVQYKVLQQVSHEQRTQINAINYYSTRQMEIIENKEDSLEAKIYEIAENILKINSFQKYLISDFFDLGKLEYGMFQLNPQEFDINESLKEAIYICNINAKKKGIELEVKKNLYKEDCMLFNDKNRVKQVLLNLLTNSIKFQEGGTITIRLSKQDDLIVIDVIDQGSGIPEKKYYAY